MQSLFTVFTALCSCVAIVTGANHTQHPHHHHHHTTHAPSTTTLDPVETEVRHLAAAVENMGRQVMLQQLFVEERIRSDGSSGLKQTRLRHYGNRPFDSESLGFDTFAAIKDVPSRPSYVEIGPNDYVINGVDFRTGKLGVRLRMGSRTEEDFDAEEDIDPPPVPPSVLNQSDVTAAIKEMQLYFKAFQRQDPKIKADYRKYFKPVLCYMEAYWASLNGSDAVKDAVRAEVTVLREDELGSGAKTYVDPYSPTTVMKAHDGRPVLAQWAHRTRCHPVQQELSLKSFFVRDDLTSRLHRRQSLPDYARSPAARFYLTPSSRQDTYHPLSGTSDYSPDVRHREMMEGLMMEVPGFNNYPANLTDNSFNMLLYQPSFSLNILNTAYYHRRFKVNKKGAMGLTISDKGFSDENMWVAQTTHEEVAEAEVTECNKNHNHCHPYSVRYTYALPLEVVWMTPLESWNPYNLRHTSGVTSSVVAHQANGHQTKPYDGTDDEHLYLTPAAFYHSPPEVTYVKDTNGNVRQTVASGISTLTPYIPGVGQVRLRYPIMPLYHDGHAAYKEIAALKNTLLNLPAHAPYFENPVPGVHSNSSDCLEIDAILTTSLATRVPPGAHVHDLYVTKDELYQLQNNRSFTLKTLTTLNSGHQHEMSLQHSRHHDVSHPKQQFIVTSCDGSHQCWDGHSNVVTLTRRPHC